MKFSIQLISSSGYRLGLLSGLRNNPDAIYETPLSLITTKCGSFPHLTPDVYHDSFSTTSMLCIPAQHFVAHIDVLQAFNKGVANFAALGSHPVSVVIQDPTMKTPSGYNDSFSVSVWDTTGRIKLSTDKYLKLVRVMLPDWFESLNDADTKSNASRKRIEKSLKNSFTYLENCMKFHASEVELKGIGIFAPLLGGHDPMDRSKWSNLIKDKEVDGYCLLGLHENGESAEKLDVENMKKCVQASLCDISRDKVRQAQGSFSPQSILELVECGVDIFDSSLAYLATERGAAFCFKNKLEWILNSESRENEELHSNNFDNYCKENHPLNPDDNPSNKKIKIGNNMIGTLDSIMVHKTAGTTLKEEVSEPFLKEERCYEINLMDKRYSNCKQPLVLGCQCYTCTNFTKSYIHHLLSVREMLASVLLMIHNLHHWELFFKTIREAIMNKKFDILKTYFNDKMDKNIK